MFRPLTLRMTLCLCLWSWLSFEAYASIERDKKHYNDRLCLNKKPISIVTFEILKKDEKGIILYIEFHNRKDAEEFWNKVSPRDNERVTIDGEDWRGWIRLDGRTGKFWGYPIEDGK